MRRFAIRYMSTMSVLLCVSISAANQVSRVTFAVTPVQPLMDDRLSISVSGLPPNRLITVKAQSKAQDQLWWRSEAVFNSGPKGTIDLSTEAPVSGTYRGVDGILENDYTICAAWDKENPMRAAFVAGVVCRTLIALFAVSMPSRAQQQVIPVWPGVAPGSENWTQKEETTALPSLAAGGPLVRNVTQPTLTAFLPSSSAANRTAVIVCPGGGFHFLSWDSEGTAEANTSSRNWTDVFKRCTLRYTPRGALHARR